MTGPIFISHSSADRDDINDLAEALREAFNGDVRMFNTSSGTAIPIGLAWRERLLESLRAAPLVVLWATASALDSREVAFEIGAALAYDKRVLPCCVHIHPKSLPWGLSEKQALLLDEPDGWRRLADEVGNIINYSGVISYAPLLGLAGNYQAPSDAVRIDALGNTIEITNTSASPISGVRLQQADAAAGTPLPEWASAAQDLTLPPHESVLLFRPSATEDVDLALVWTDITGTSQTRRIQIAATSKAASE